MQKTFSHASCSTKHCSFLSRAECFERILYLCRRKCIEHTNGTDSEENIGRNDVNDDPSADEGINGLRRKEMVLTRTNDRHIKKHVLISYPS
jgi:hypothetical protein